MVKTVGELRQILNSCADDLPIVFQDKNGKALTNVWVFPSHWKTADTDIWLTAQGAQEVRYEGEKIETFERATLIFDLE